MSKNISVQVSNTSASLCTGSTMMNKEKNIGLKMLLLLLVACCMAPFVSNAQVNAVEFGKNRVQFKKFKWQYYQTKNFNVYFNQGGQELAKYVVQIAEKELPQIEAAAEYSLQRRANIILYNQYSDMQQSNIGLGIEWQNTSGITKLVNNKMVVYFDADHDKLRKQVRGGIAQVLTDNVLFGDDLGEVAGNQALLDLPKWLTDGYAAYLAENWSTDLDDELKSEMLSGDYKNFYKFAFIKPEIAGHGFWYYIEEKYKKENVTYLLYLARVYKNLNKACMQVCKKKFKEVLADFMEYESDKYYQDISKRKPYPKGSFIDGFDISKRVDYFRFNVNPNKRNNSYVVTYFKKGIVRVIYNDEDQNKTLLKFGTRSQLNEINPNYPMMAWDPKGTRITCVYVQEGRLKLFTYDIVRRLKEYKLDLTDKFDQIQDIKYILNSNKLLVSAVKNGHTDIYTFDLKSEKVVQITNDVYDDLDPSFVAFPNKTGIIFASNRPDPAAKSGDTTLPSNNHYNIFLITNFGDKPELNQITQLSHLKYGNARLPMQYNGTHFTFVSDENGVGNRYAGFFSTKAAGLDTLVLVDEEILHNPSKFVLDSTLRIHKKSEADSVAVVAITQDSAYTFPLTNYQSKLYETRIAGDNNQVSEVTREGNEKDLYKLKIDEQTLTRRNVNAQPTAYMKKKMAEYDDKGKSSGKKAVPIDEKKQDDIFQTEFANDKKDSATTITPGEVMTVTKVDKNNVLKTAKLYRYKPPKFSVDYGSAGFNNSVLINKYQTYQYGNGPISLNSGTPLNGLIRLGTSDLLEDTRITGGFKLSSNLKDNEWLISYQNLKRRLDWGLTYYRSVQSENGITSIDTAINAIVNDPGKIITNLYQANISYPFDATKSIRISTGIRSDRSVFASYDGASLVKPDIKKIFSVSEIQFVYDNTINPTMNIWHGLRYKVYMDFNSQVNKNASQDGPNTFNLGFDARYYYPIYRNFIWAGRAAGDFSWGNQKILYYLGGVDGWLQFGNNARTDGSGTYRYFTPDPQPAADQDYAYQSLTVNMRGFVQNVANGNNAVVMNSEFRLPVFSTFFNKPINNAVIRNFQLVQFIDLGTAWNGNYNGIKRPEVSYTNVTNNVTVRKKAGGIGPFAGGYGFGARTTLLGYFVKFDAAWPMDVFFKGKPIMYFALGLDF